MNNSNKPLVSILILCYRHFDFITNAIDSVLKQIYDNIELIISDDGSEDFPRDEIYNYVNKYKKSNIKKFLINQEKQNNGTVKHLNNAIKLSTGEYIIALAGDDSLYDQNVTRKYLDGFEKAGINVYIEMAQTAMYDKYLNKFQYYYLEPSVKSALEKEQYMYQLFNMLANFPCLPSTSTCFKREFFEKFGFFDEKYKLIEDCPMHLRLAREGWRIHYENFVAIKHRDGGISHGGDNAFSKTKFLYYKDLLKISKEEIEPYYSLLDNKIRKSVIKKKKFEKIWIDSQFYHLVSQNKILYLLKFIAIHPVFILKRFFYYMNLFLYRILMNVTLVSLIVMSTIPLIKKVLNYILDSNFKVESFYIFPLYAFLISLILLIPCFIGKLIIKVEKFPEDCLN